MPQITISRDELRQRVNDGRISSNSCWPRSSPPAYQLGAINIPLAKLSEKTVASLDKKNATLVHCYEYQ